MLRSQRADAELGGGFLARQRGWLGDVGLLLARGYHLELDPASVLDDLAHVDLGHRADGEHDGGG